MVGLLLYTWLYPSTGDELYFDAQQKMKITSFFSSFHKYFVKLNLFQKYSGIMAIKKNGTYCGHKMLPKKADSKIFFFLYLQLHLLKKTTKLSQRQTNYHLF